MKWWLIVVALSACRDKQAPPQPGSASAAPTPAAQAAPTPAPSRATTPAPVLPDSDAGVDIRGLPPAQAFAAEKPDPAWAGVTERTVRTRLAKVPGVKVECKETLCEVAVTTDAMKAVDQLQELRDIAQSVTLAQPPDGGLRAYIKFDRLTEPL